MDIGRFVDSAAIRAYLKEQNYPFSAQEAAFLVYHCKTASLEERVRAWEEIMSGTRPAEGNGPYGRLSGTVPFLCGGAHGPRPTGHSAGIHFRRAGAVCAAAITGNLPLHPP